MEFVDGGSLLQLLEAHPRGLPVERVRCISRSLVDAICGMHRCGYFHRDLKPENILIAGHDQVKLCDLGDAAKVNCQAPRTEYIATRWYRAPEILCKHSDYGAPVDVWAFGCIVFEMLSGAALFAAASEAGQLEAIQHCLGPMPEAVVERGGGAAAIGRAEAAEAKSLEARLKGKVEADSLADSLSLLCDCLRLVASARPRPRDLLSSSFLAAVKAAHAEVPARLAVRAVLAPTICSTNVAEVDDEDEYEDDFCIASPDPYGSVGEVALQTGAFPGRSSLREDSMIEEYLEESQSIHRTPVRSSVARAIAIAPPDDVPLPRASDISRAFEADERFGDVNHVGRAVGELQFTQEPSAALSSAVDRHLPLGISTGVVGVRVRERRR